MFGDDCALSIFFIQGVEDFLMMRFGIVGLFVATPLLAVIMVLIQMVYIEDVLGDRDTEVTEKVPEPEVEKTVTELQETE